MDWKKLFSYWGPLSGGTVVLAWIVIEWLQFKSMMCKEILWASTIRRRLVESIPVEDPTRKALLDGTVDGMAVDINQLTMFCRGFL